MKINFFPRDFALLTPNIIIIALFLLIKCFLRLILRLVLFLLKYYHYCGYSLTLTKIFINNLILRKVLY